MSDQQITCSECGGVFVFTEAEQDFYASKSALARWRAWCGARGGLMKGGANGLWRLSEMGGAVNAGRSRDGHGFAQICVGLASRSGALA